MRPGAAIFCAQIIFFTVAVAAPAPRVFQPEDLYRIRQVGASGWSPDGHYVAIELGRPSDRLDSVPTSEIAILDVRTRAIRTISSNAPSYIGFFNPVWSPDGRRLAFLSVDTNAFVQPWTWAVGAASPVPVRGLDVRVGIEDPPIVWTGPDRVALLCWDTNAEKSGDLYFRILRGRNVADQWQRTHRGTQASVSVLESGSANQSVPSSARLVAVNLRTNSQFTLARGSIHRVRVSDDHRLIEFMAEEPGIPGGPVSAYFDPAINPDKIYDAPNWGTVRHVIDAGSGNPVPISDMQPPTSMASSKSGPAPSPPVAGARRLSESQDGASALFLSNSGDGSQLWVCGGAGRPLSACAAVWHANGWVQDIAAGTARPVTYNALDGTPLTGWLLLPPGYAQGTRVPMVVIVYPGAVYGSTPPASFSLLRTDFEHPQLLAALGYAVLLPSMPSPKDPAASHLLSRLPSGVLPAVDAAVALGVADADRVAVLGQSDGGFAALGLTTQTNRFRSAIASAAASDFVSFYGTFYGAYRYGDAGAPQKGQVLRMLQMEKGVYGLGGPPSREADRYRDASAIFSADKVQTPVMLIHGDLDFVPIQQAEEFFTSLYRQDKRSVFVRYQGEWHTISSRPNVLDLWRRIANWLSETMAPRG